MKSLLIAASAAAVALPVIAPAPAEAQSRVNREIRECQRELARADNRREYTRAQRDCQREIAQAQRADGRNGNYINLRSRQSYRNFDWKRYEPGHNAYYADRYYRSGSSYSPRQMSRNDRIYRGRDGRYYCRRDDGTTGLIVGAGLGALLGNQLNVGGSTMLSTIIGGAAGAMIGREIDRGGVRCN